MNFKRVIAVGVIVASLGLTAAQGKTLKDAETPANFPPSSFKGKQFVDNRGCTYIRAGIDGLVQWVPRVTRSRKVVCGKQPTFGGGTTAVAAAPKPSPVVKIVPKAAPVAKTAPAPKPQVRQVARAPKPVVRAPKPVVRQQPVRRAAPAPQVITPKAVTPTVRRVQVQPKPVARTTQPVRRAAAPTRVQRQPTRRTSCANFTGISAQYAGRGAGVRCGSQGQSVNGMTVSRQPVQVVRNGQRVTVQKRVVTRAPVPQPQVRTTNNYAQTQRAIVQRNKKTGVINAPGSTRVMPRHVYENKQASRVTSKVPNGYRPAWTDDRLNPNRANMSVNGIRQSDLVWTRTLPRKLYLRSSGKVVTHMFPQMRYPYTSMADQNRAMGLTTSTKNTSAVRKAKPVAKTQASAGGRYVQVGTFGQHANANRAASRLQAAGLPVRMSSLNRSGKSYRVVLAGPFSSGQLNNALAKARRAGFSDAFVR